jgi:hypothetical protein
MRYVPITFVLILAASCAKEPPSAQYEAMQNVKWARSAADCGIQYVTFSESINLHFPDGAVEFGKIVLSSDASPTDVILTVEPSTEIVNSAHIQNKKLPRAITMGFRVTDQQIKLLAMMNAEDNSGGLLSENAPEYRLFDLRRCA